MLTIVSAVRTGIIAQYFQAERQMLKLIFAFDQIIYNRHNSFQHLFLGNHSKDNQHAFDDLLRYRFRAPSSGDGDPTFSKIHGDLITEHFSKESKGRIGPFRSGYISHRYKRTVTSIRLTKGL